MRTFKDHSDRPKSKYAQSDQPFMPVNAGYHFPCHRDKPCLICQAFIELAIEIPYPFLDIQAPLMCNDCLDANYLHEEQDIVYPW
jgi:hypothetical protein